MLIDRVTTGSVTSDADTNAVLLTTFVEVLSVHCPNLEELALSENNLGVPRATALARVISRHYRQSQIPLQIEKGSKLNQNKITGLLFVHVHVCVPLTMDELPYI